jgi:hypothetical protein
MATTTNQVNGHAGTTLEELAPEKTAPEKTKSRKDRVRDLLSQMEESLGTKAKNATVADFIRLTQLERELEQDEQPGKVVVTWKESPEIQDSET